ncbi:MAG: hypothetical protein WA749_03260, partial [Gelidibacter sp.]
GAQKDMLEESGMAHLISVDDVSMAAEQLYQVFSTEQVMIPNQAFIDSFHIEKLTETLANEIKNLD